MSGRGAAVLLCFGLLATAASLAQEARADEAPAEDTSIVVVLCAPGDRFGLRIRAELEALGFQAVLIAPEAEPTSRASLESSARRAGAIAAIHAVPSERGVEVWIADRVTGKTVLREMASDDETRASDAARALRVVELLRASLLEVAVPGPPSGEVPATPEIRDKLRLPPPEPLVEKPAPRLRLALAPGVLLSPGGFGASASLVLDLAFMSNEHLGVVGFAALPLTRARIERPEGSADLGVWLAGGALRFLFTTRESRWAPTADLGAAVVALTSTGTASADLIARSASGVIAAPFGRLGIAYAPTPLFHVRADALVGAVVQDVSVRFAEQGVATWGAPFALSSVGVDFGWF